MRAWLLFLLCGSMAYSSAYALEPGKEAGRGRSAGCGIARTGTGNFMPVEMRVLKRERTYHLRVPETYDPDRAYPLIFRWHGAGGNGLSGGLGIELNAGNDAIIVSADGLHKSWNSDADSAELLFDAESTDLLFSADPENLLFFDRMLETIEKQYCINQNRIFSYGFSAGGYFGNLLACERGDVLRANAAIAGGLRGGNCRGKVASWFLHDADDTVVPIAKGKAARDRALAMNGCLTNTVDAGEGCVRYQGCEAATVIWCESRGFGHNIRSDFAPARVWKFFLELP